MESTGRNLYVYTENDPVNFNDPSGHGILSAIRNKVVKVAKSVCNTAKKVFNTVKNSVVNI